MNVNKLEVGKEYKNYKTMCMLLEEKPKSGNSKKSQLKEWERYFSFRNEGHKFIIEKIYDDTLDKIENRGGARHFLSHAERMDQILLYIIYKEKTNGELFLSFISLLREMNMVNKNYKFANNNKKKAATYLNINLNVLEEFFDISRKTFRNNIESMLNRLENKSLIFWSKVKTICIIDVNAEINTLGYIKVDTEVITDEYENEEIIIHDTYETNKVYRPAEKEEIELILQIEGDVMDDLKCRNKQELIVKNKWNEFNQLVNKRLRQEANILFYYDSYQIIRNMDRIEKELYDNNTYKLEKSMLNSDVQKQLELNMFKRANKANEKKPIEKYNKKIIMRSDENYVTEGMELIHSFIDTEHIDITDKIKRTIPEEKIVHFEKDIS